MYHLHWYGKIWTVTAGNSSTMSGSDKGNADGQYVRQDKSVGESQDRRDGQGTPGSITAASGRDVSRGIDIALAVR